VRSHGVDTQAALAPTYVVLGGIVSAIRKLLRAAFVLFV